MWGFDASPWKLKFLSLKPNNFESQYKKQKLIDKYGKRIDLRNRMGITQCCNTKTVIVWKQAVIWESEERWVWALRFNQD